MKESTVAVVRDMLSAGCSVSEMVEAVKFLELGIIPKNSEVLNVR